MFSLDTSWLLAVLAGLVTLYAVKYILDVKRLPPGPLPLPIVGSLLVFWRSKDNFSSVFKQLAKKYDGIYTIWVGAVPFVFVANWQLCKEALVTKRNDFISRPNFKSAQHSMKNTDAIVFHGNNKQWEASRKIAFSAIRKLSDSETMTNIVHQNVREMVDRMLALRGPFNPKEIIQETVFDIIAETAFGTKKLSESDFRIFKTQEELFHQSMTISPAEFFPILSPFFKNIENNIRRSTENVGACFHRKFQELKKSYSHEKSRHFGDAIIFAKIEAEGEENVNSKYLADDNMRKILSDLFLAGTDTTTSTLQWMFLALSQFPEVQGKMREEIKENIGERAPQPEDRLNCPYTWAFISELLRLRPAAPMMLPHATSEDTELGGHKIAKGTVVVFDTRTAHFDPTLWEEPEKLKPERFLEADGTYTKSRLQGYLAFGEGKRNCIGEKMARNDLFLALAIVLQNVQIVRHGSEKSTVLEAENQPFFNVPKDYEITLIKNI